MRERGIGLIWRGRKLERLGDFSNAVLNLEGLIGELHKAVAFKGDLRAKLLSAFCEPFLLHATLNDSSIRADPYLQDYEALDKVALSLEEQFPRYRELALSRDLMFFTVQTLNLVDSVGEPERTERLILPEKYLSKPVEFSAVELLDKRTEKSESIDLLIQLCSLRIYRLVSYNAYKDLLLRAWKPAADKAEKEKFILAVGNLVKRVEPTSQNQRANGWLYRFLKPALNELAFRHFIESTQLDEGFEWVESYNHGLDFLQMEEIRRRFDENVARFIHLSAHVERKFYIKENDFPYDHDFCNLVKCHDIVYGNDDEVLYKQKLLSYYATAEIYWDALQHSYADQITKEKIKDRILYKTEEVRKWVEGINDIKRVTLPDFVAQIFEERKDYDLAIEHFKECYTTKPIGLFFGAGGAINFRIASNTPLNCASYFFSRSSSFLARSLCVVRSSLSLTNARMISMLTWAARLLLSTPDSIATPCSVKTLGSFLVPPQLDVPKWNFKFSNSFFAR